jgi:hypothetical protein
VIGLQERGFGLILGYRPNSRGEFLIGSHSPPSGRHLRSFRFNRCCRFLTSEAMGLRKSITSSAYKLVLKFMGSDPIGESSPCCVAMSSIFCNGSITKMNSMGDKWSPCRSPRVCLIGLPGSPLSNIPELVVLQIRAIMSLHLGSKPTLSMTSSKYSQRTLSNAFMISSLRSSIGVFTWWK